MKKYFLIISFLFLTTSLSARGRFTLGPELGFILQNQTAGNSSAWSPGVPIGVAGVFQFDRELSNFALDYSIGYSSLQRFVIRNATFGGITGTYREKTHLFQWMFGGRYYFLRDNWRPWVGCDFGFNYFKRSNVEFRDSFNTALPTPNVSNNFNLSLIPHAGIEYRPTFRWAIGLSLKPILSLRSSGIVPGVAIPLTVQVAF